MAVFSCSMPKIVAGSSGSSSKKKRTRRTWLVARLAGAFAPALPGVLVSAAPEDGTVVFVLVAAVLLEFELLELQPIRAAAPAPRAAMPPLWRKVRRLVGTMTSSRVVRE